MNRLLLAAALAAVAAVPILADAPKPPPGTPVPGGAVVSPDAKLVFVPAKDGGIEALAVATGKPVWTNPDAKNLAGASGGHVIAWVADEKKPNTFRVVVMEAATGKTVTKSEVVEMPDWATTAKTWGRTFRTAARAEADPVVVVWEARASYAGGARPTPEIEKAARKEAVGVVTVDMQTGKVKVLDRKPTNDEFKPGPGGGVTTKVGEYEFRATEMIPKFKPGAAMVTTVTLTVLKGKDELWSRELAGNPWSPPPP
jgi:hypothetical protein